MCFWPPIYTKHTKIRLKQVVYICIFYVFYNLYIYKFMQLKKKSKSRSINLNVSPVKYWDHLFIISVKIFFFINIFLVMFYLAQLSFITWKCTSLAMLGSAINIWCSREQMRHCTSLMSLSNPPSVPSLSPTGWSLAFCDEQDDHKAPACRFSFSGRTETDRGVLSKQEPI